MNTSLSTVGSPLTTSIRVFLYGLLLTLALATTAAAADGSWTVGFGVGSSDFGGDANLDFRTDVRGGYYFNSRFGIEAQWIRASAILDDSLDTWMINGVFELRPGKAVAPYLLAGVGAARLEDVRFLSPHLSTSHSGTALQAAVGARFFFSEEQRMGARVELSGLQENTDVFDSDRHTSVTAGMTWKFGR